MPFCSVNKEHFILQTIKTKIYNKNMVQCPDGTIGQCIQVIVLRYCLNNSHWPIESDELKSFCCQIGNGVSIDGVDGKPEDCPVGFAAPDDVDDT